MSEQRTELDDWRDLVGSAGWKRLLDIFEQQWSDARLLDTLEKMTAGTSGTPGTSIAEESWRLMKMRTALRQFLAIPAKRVSDLERRLATETAPTKPWTRPA